ncbi:hypothetical protein [Actinoplanes xinjiangensis]
MAIGSINPDTRLMVMPDASTGRFGSGWKLYPHQFADIVGKDCMR